MSGLLRIVPLWGWLLIGVAAVLVIQQWKLTNTQASLEAMEQSRKQAEQRASSLRNTLSLQRDLIRARDLTDQKYQEDLNNVAAENAQLTADLDASRRRLSVNATCVRQSTRYPVASSSSDAGTAELTAEARRNYLDLRAGLKQQRVQIIGLQQYISELLKLSCSK